MVFNIYKITFLAVLLSLAIPVVIAVPCHVSAADTADTLKFSHKTHVKDQEIACIECHTDAALNTGRGMTNHPKMKACQKCHEDQISEKNCTQCHSSAKSEKPFTVQLKHKNFSHAGHLKRGVECTYCHKNVENIATASEKNMPTVETCWSCHDDKKAPRNCHLCHEDPQKVKPASHRSPWFMRKEHGRDARFNRMECEKCHQEVSCDACHMGQNALRIHDPNYIVVHGMEAKRGDKDCTVCHASQQSCIRCHEGRR